MSNAAEMQDRRHDVDELVSILTRSGRPCATAEDAFQAWSAHSDGSCASWLIFLESSMEDREEVVRAYDRFTLERISDLIGQAVPEHRFDEAADVAANFLSSSSVDPEDADALIVKSSAREETVGRMQRHWDDDRLMLAALLEHFGVDLPEGYDVHPVSRILESFGLTVEDPA